MWVVVFEVWTIHLVSVWLSDVLGMVIMWVYNIISWHHMIWVIFIDVPAWVILKVTWYLFIIWYSRTPCISSHLLCSSQTTASLHGGSVSLRTLLLVTWSPETLLPFRCVLVFIFTPEKSGKRLYHLAMYYDFRYSPILLSHKSIKRSLSKYCIKCLVFRYLHLMRSDSSFLDPTLQLRHHSTEHMWLEPLWWRCTGPGL